MNPLDASRKEAGDKQMIWGSLHKEGVPKASCKRKLEITIAGPDDVYSTITDALCEIGYLKEFEAAPIKFKRGYATMIKLIDLL